MYDDLFETDESRAENKLSKIRDIPLRDLLSDKLPDSSTQIQRYIRLTNLIPKILEMVDEKKIAFRPAVELSYLTEKEQQMLLEIVEHQDATPSLSQSIKMKKYSREGEITHALLSSIMQEEKPNQRIKSTFDERIANLIPKSIQREKQPEYVVKVLEYYKKYLQRNKKEKTL